MSSVGHTDYDANLLAGAPVATKAQLQSGYATDLLEDKKPVSARKDPRVDDPEAGRNHVEKHLVTPNTTDDSIPPKPLPTPFYRTRRGIIIIAVVVAVVLAAIIGGAVAGSVNKSVPSQSTAANQTPDSGPGSGIPTDSTSANPVSAMDPTLLPSPVTSGSGVTATGGGGRAVAQVTPLPGPLNVLQEFGLAT